MIHVQSDFLVLMVGNWHIPFCGCNYNGFAGRRRAKFFGQIDLDGQDIFNDLHFYVFHGDSTLLCMF